jgi:hypothetical protein
VSSGRQAPPKVCYFRRFCHKATRTRNLNHGHYTLNCKFCMVLLLLLVVAATYIAWSSDEPLSTTWWWCRGLGGEDCEELCAHPHGRSWNAILVDWRLVGLSCWKIDSLVSDHVKAKLEGLLGFRKNNDPRTSLSGDIYWLPTSNQTLGENHFVNTVLMVSAPLYTCSFTCTYILCELLE